LIKLLVHGAFLSGVREAPLTDSVNTIFTLLTVFEKTLVSVVSCFSAEHILETLIFQALRTII
ncbi:MAG: hypothetical protein J5750_05225, partial [Clostridiales bacterium]|nr:hypothetical protein [Clostridiales bacterium]